MFEIASNRTVFGRPTGPYGPNNNHRNLMRINVACSISRLNMKLVGFGSIIPQSVEGNRFLKRQSHGEKRHG